MDWSKCIICGTADGILKCPASKIDGTGLQSYEDLLKLVHGFREINALPAYVCMPEDINVTDLLSNNAKWHTPCRIKFAQSKLDRGLERRAKKRNIEESGSATVQRKSKRSSQADADTSTSKFKTMCLFCKKTEGVLHNCSYLRSTLKDQATEMQDNDVLAAVGGGHGDVVSLELKYHKHCMDVFRNRHRSFKREQSVNSEWTDQQKTESRAFAETISFIESCVEEGTYMFKLADLHKMYEDRLEELGHKQYVHKTRFKYKLLNYYPDECQEQSDGKRTLLVFNKGLQSLLKETITTPDFEKDAMSMVQVAKCIRKEMFECEIQQFDGSFAGDCQQVAVPNSLKVLVSMLLYGINIKDKNCVNSQVCLTIGQLIRYNSKQKANTTVIEHPRHRKDKEMPLPLYIGLKVHTQTRSKKMVTQLHELGISVSYARVLELEDQLTNAVCERFANDGLVCPTQIRDGVYTAGALDNLDHNPTSATAEGSFHGTSISLFQMPTLSNPGICRQPIIIPPSVCKKNPSLPDSYSIVPVVACNTDVIQVAETAAVPDTTDLLSREKETEKQWLDEKIPLLAKDKLENGDMLSWAAHHADRQPDTTDPPGISALMPLFYEKAATMAMVKHGMDIVKVATQMRNPGQIPIIVGDQPIYALAKYAQWNWPNTLGESMYIVMLGGLHTEMALWRMVADLLEGSGWCAALTEAGIATSGTADSFLKVAHLTKTRHAHQVTAMSLAKLQSDAFTLMSHSDDEERSFGVWKDEMGARSPTFRFWDMLLQLQLLVLTFVRSHRERNLALYVEAMEALAPWFFALDHINYARWLPVHIKDMKALRSDVKLVLEQNWVLTKTRRKFASMPLDQAHEQNNETVKGSGGAIGLTENPAALKRWMVAGPEQARILSEFEELYHSSDEASQNHEQGYSTQERFQKQVNNMCDTIVTMGNPFMDTSHELMTLDTHDCLDDTVAQSLHTVSDLGTQQYSTYVNDVLVERKVSIHQAIKKNKMPLFKTAHSTTVRSKAKQQFQAIKSDCNLFSQLFITAQVRNTKLEDFFSHENHPWPPALSLQGKLRLPSSKSELLECICPKDQIEGSGPTDIDAKVIDGAGIVHALPHERFSTFGEYSNTVFIPWIERQLQSCSRIDIIWDTYRSDSLKAATREKRGKGVRRKVSHTTKLPGQFTAFLQDDTNKEELFALLSEDVINHEFPSTKTVTITSGRMVASNDASIAMEESDHEEADSRLCLHVHDAIKNGATTVLVRTVDTDVVVILVGVFPDIIMDYPDTQLWVGFGAGKHFRYINVNAICQELGTDKSRALPFFHAFSGSDVTSQFCGKGKKSAWKTWKAYPDATEAFTISPETLFVPIGESSSAFKIIERFTCAMYDSTTPIVNVNALRQEMFTTKVKMMENLPPTQSALLHHVNRSLYQASIWRKSLDSLVVAPIPEGFGWTKSDRGWCPTWTTLPAAAISCRELVKCGCKASPICSKNCRCRNACLACTTLCFCRGNCEA